jgi:uncharacterized membrane protein (DUF485 family)
MKDDKYVWFSAFRRVVPADYEDWLEKMAAEGWHLKRIGQWSSIRMRFYRGEPKKYRFVYDIQPSPKKDYIPAFEQFGWEFIGQMASAFIWRMEYTDERPEAFSDRESMDYRNRRTALAASVSLVIFLVMALFFLVLLVFFRDTMDESARVQIGIALGFILLLALLVFLAVRAIRKRGSW